MTCMYCQGELKRGTAPFHIDRRGVHLQVDAVPAWVCTQCGEPYFEEQEVDSIQAILREVDKQAETLAKIA